MLRLESRPKNVEGQGEVPIRELLRNSLRMRPDRIIVGEMRGAEALDMLQAMNTGHDGSMSTTHANTPRDAVARIESMVLMAGIDFPMRAIRQQLLRALDLIVQIERSSDGCAPDHEHHRGAEHGGGYRDAAGHLRVPASTRRRVTARGSWRLHRPAAQLQQVRAQRRAPARVHGSAQLRRRAARRRQRAAGARRAPEDCGSDRGGWDGDRR